jgi:23S rRNA (uracil1939-C5)-methyltransferase
MKTTVTLTITEVAYGGKGIGRHEGKVCFVPGVLPGETVVAERVRDRGGYWEARLREIVEPVPARVAPACPYAFQCPAAGSGVRAPAAAGACPGCCYQQAAYGEELRIKERQLQSLMLRHARVDADVFQPPVPAAAPLGYRNKMALHAQADGAAMRLGYVLEDNATILDIAACPLAVPPLNALLQQLREEPSFRRTLKDGMTVTFRWTEPNGAVWWRNRAAENDVWLVESSRIGPLSVPRNSFYQMNPVMADRLVEAVQERVRAALPGIFVDLYCGIGVFALAAAALGVPQVIGVDLDGPGIKAADYNARKLGFANTTWKAVKAQEGIRQLTLARPGHTTLLVDPPRTGLGLETVRQVLKQRPARLLYVSCAPDTLARDVAWLKEGGYAVGAVQLFDLFPRTAHFETLAELRLEA